MQASPSKTATTLDTNKSTTASHQTLLHFCPSPPFMGLTAFSMGRHLEVIRSRAALKLLALTSACLKHKYITALHAAISPVMQKLPSPSITHRSTKFTPCSCQVRLQCTYHQTCFYCRQVRPRRSSDARSGCGCVIKIWGQHDLNPCHISRTRISRISDARITLALRCGCYHTLALL